MSPIAPTTTDEYKVLVVMGIGDYPLEESMPTPTEDIVHAKEYERSVLCEYKAVLKETVQKKLKQEITTPQHDPHYSLALYDVLELIEVAW